MSKYEAIFMELPCLTECSQILNGPSLQKKWFKNADRRILGHYFQKFISYNSSNFEFLGIQPILVGSDQNITLSFKTSNYVGTIPLRAPDTGKQIGDFVVTPRFTGKDRFNEYIKIITLLQHQVFPEVKDSIPLASGKSFQPPLYLEAMHYISSIEELLRIRWNKFQRTQRTISEPAGQINWTEYIRNVYKSENIYKFPCFQNKLSEYHLEYSWIKYVYEICRSELLSSRVPERLKASMKSSLQYIDEKLYFHRSIPTTFIEIKYSDLPNIKNCKILANRILKNQYTIGTAWRVDIAEVFEKFVQYLFSSAAKEIGGNLLPNHRIIKSSKVTSNWELKYLEPDAVFMKKDLIIYIDAKYRSNLYNRWDYSDMLKKEHRFDIHQILAYSSFDIAKFKYSILCYPSYKIGLDMLKYTNPSNSTSNNLLIIGIPLDTDQISSLKVFLSDIINWIDLNKLDATTKLIKHPNLILVD